MTDLNGELLHEFEYREDSRVTELDSFAVLPNNEVWRQFYKALLLYPYCTQRAIGLSANPIVLRTAKTHGVLAVLSTKCLSAKKQPTKFMSAKFLKPKRTSVTA